MRVRIELLDVFCQDTEDVTGADTLYLVGGASDGIRTQSFLTNRIWINNGQNRAFAADRSVLFEGNVPAGGMISLGMQAIDEDAQKDWNKHGEWIIEVADAIAAEIEQLPQQSPQPFPQPFPQQPPTAPQSGSSLDPAKTAAAILRGTVRAIGFFASMDKDDSLGTMSVVIPVGAPGTAIREWRCRGQRYGGLLGWSRWDYTIRYRITQVGELANTAIVYGNTIKLRHVVTTRTLHSHGHAYGHPGTSGQQQVTAYEYTDDNDLWIVKPGHSVGDRSGQPVQNGEIVRLQHVATGRNLHSHLGHPSPVTRQQEVTCFGDNGNGDDNDNWRVELTQGSSWQSNSVLRLIHVNSNAALHSHQGFSHPAWTMGQQEVTAYDGRDDNDLWQVSELR